MSPRRTSRTSPHQSGSKGGKGKERAPDREDTSHSGSDRSQSAAKSGHAHWTIEDEDFLIKSIATNKVMAMMGDGQMFRPAFWTEVASKFPQPVRGKAKTADSCKEKWKRMKNTFDSVHSIASSSGLAYTLEKGADLRPDNQFVWDEIVKNTKGVSKFKHKGWIHYEKMLTVVKSKSRGNHKNAPLHTVESAASRPGPSSIITSSTNPTTPSLPMPPGYLPPSFGPPAPAPHVPMSNLPPSFTPQPQTSLTYPQPSPSSIPPGLIPPSIPSSYVGSSASSVKPSSSISARMGKRKADDDDVSMVSAPGASGSVVSAVSGTSSSRKRRATQKEEITELRDDIGTLQSTFQSNMELMRTMSSRPAVPVRVPLETISPQTALDTAEQRKKARRLLLQLDKDLLAPKELVTMFDIFRSNDDSIDAYIVLASTEDMKEVRFSWLKKRVAEAREKK